jgi:hypothetical protein
MTYEEMVSRVSNSTGLSKALVNRTYKTYWRTVKEYIESLPLKQNLTEEEFKELKPNVNIPSIGKFYVTPRIYKITKYKRH